MLGSFNPNGFFYSSFNPAQLNMKSFSNTIMRLFPNGSAPLYALTGEANRTKAKSVTHGYFTKHMAYASISIDGAKVAGDTTITIDSNDSIVPGMVFQVPATRENIRVNAVTNSTTLVIDRAFGRVVAGALADDAVLKLVGNAYAEATNRPTARHLKSVWVPNYTVLIRNAWSISGTATAEMAEAGFNNLAETKADCMEFHATDIEGHMFWGQPLAPTTDATTGKPIHATQGIVDAIYQYASGNVQTAGATTTYAQLVSLVEGMFTYTSSKTGGGMKERVMYCDSLAMKVMHEIGRLSGDVTMTQAETSFGMQYTNFKIYKGTIRLIEHPLFNEMAPSTGFAVGIDLTSIGVAYLEGRDVLRESYKGSSDGSNSGIDADGGGLLSEFATQFMAPSACGVITGLTAGAA